MNMSMSSGIKDEDTKKMNKAKLIKEIE